MPASARRSQVNGIPLPNDRPLALAAATRASRMAWVVRTPSGNRRAEFSSTLPDKRVRKRKRLRPATGCLEGKERAERSHARRPLQAESRVVALYPRRPKALVRSALPLGVRHGRLRTLRRRRPANEYRYRRERSSESSQGFRSALIKRKC